MKRAVDAVVIGGGIAGVSVAARLSHVCKVRLVERECGLGYHASGRSAALYEQNYGKQEVVALNRASYGFFDKSGLLTPRGLLLIAGETQMEQFAAEAKEMDLERISKKEALALWPDLNVDQFAGAAYGSHAWDIDTDRMLQNFARELRGNGGELSMGAGVKKINKVVATNLWQVQLTSDEILDTPTLVNAAGAWVGEIAAMATLPLPLARFSPLRRSMARIPAPRGLDPCKWPLLMGAGEAWYAKPDAGALIVSPAEEFLMEPHDAYVDDLVLAEGIARYQQHVQTPVSRLISSWAGLRTFASDRLLVLGPDPRDPSFVWCGGQGGYGFQTCPAASQLVADLVSGRMTPLQEQLGLAVVAAFSPARFLKS